MLFQRPQEELSDAEIAAILRQAMAGAGRLPRSADVLLAGMRAEHLREAARLPKLGLMLLASKIERAAIVLIETRRKGSVMRGLAHCARS